MIRKFNSDGARHPAAAESPSGQQIVGEPVAMVNVICLVPRSRRDAPIHGQAYGWPASKTIVPRDPNFVVEPDTGNS